MFRTLMVATALSTLVPALTATVQAAPPHQHPSVNLRGEQSYAAGWLVIHLTHGQWVSEHFYRQEDAYAQLQMYRAYGIPAHMRGV